MTTDDVGASIGWFPVVGALLGLILVLVDGWARIFLATPIVNALLVAVLAALSGALHLDGVIDTADGMAAGQDRATRLAAMRQTQAGAPGAAAGIITILAAYAALSAVPAGLRTTTLLIMPIAGRTMILLGYALYPYARPDPGVSQSLKQSATPVRTIFGLSFAIAVAAANGSLPGIGLLFVAFIWLHIAASSSRRLLGGLTGDVVGAICETSQIATLVAAPLLRVP